MKFAVADAQMSNTTSMKSTPNTKSGIDVKWESDNRGDYSFYKHYCKLFNLRNIIKTYIYPTNRRELMISKSQKGVNEKKRYKNFRLEEFEILRSRSAKIKKAKAIKP